MSTDIIKLKSTADILGGDIFFATEAGTDPEHSQNGDLLPNGMYIRLEGSDGSLAYVSAYELDKALEVINDLSTNKADQSDVDVLQSLSRVMGDVVTEEHKAAAGVIRNLLAVHSKNEDLINIGAFFFGM